MATKKIDLAWDIISEATEEIKKLDLNEEEKNEATEMFEQNL